jgi:threonine/homoserine/homoserine lactone efflux protein
MALSIVAAFWCVSILFVITPGVDWAYAISAGLQGKVVLPAVAGLLLGHLLATLVVAAGVGALLAQSSLALASLTAFGAGYLLWLGLNMLLHPSKPQTGSTRAAETRLRWAIKGVCISGMNPKVFLLFLALLPQFTTPHTRLPVALQIMTLGLIHIGSCAVVYLLVGFSAQAVLQTRPQAARLVSRFSGLAMVTIALVLITEQTRQFFN